MQLKLLLSFLFFFFFLHFAFSSSIDEVSGFVYAGCSQAKYSPSTPYQYNLNSLLASFANAAAMSNYANFTSFAASTTSPVYGFFQCRGGLSILGCSSCVRIAINQLSLLCSSAAAATVQLQGCVIRYSNESFLGEPDKTLLYKKCGPNTGNTGLAAARESVLGGLEVGGQGPYRVARAGNVDGLAQCMGDQKTDQCDDCVSEAVSDLRTACGGPVVSGEVYLAKCYVEYWFQRTSPDQSYQTGHYGKESGKEMAIIIGIAAAVLLLILFLYFLSKSPGHEGK